MNTASVFLAGGGIAVLGSIGFFVRARHVWLENERKAFPTGSDNAMLALVGIILLIVGSALLAIGGVLSL